MMTYIPRMIFMSGEQLERLDEVCRKKNKSRKDILEQAVDEFLDRESPRNPNQPRVRTVKNNLW
jgi:hypothetical protein